MPVDPVTAGEIIEEAWGDSVASAITALEAAPPAHGASHQPGASDALTTAAPGASAVGDTAAAGTSTALPRADHRHSREAFGTPGASAVGDTVAAGSASTPARSDHRHSREAFAAPVAVGNANAAGSASTPARSDHVHNLTGPAVQAVRGVSTGSIGGATAVNVTITWPSAFADANYTATVIVALDDDAAGRINVGIRSRTASQIVVRVRNDNAGAWTPTLDAIGIHD